MEQPGRISSRYVHEVCCDVNLCWDIWSQCRLICSVDIQSVLWGQLYSSLQVSTLVNNIVKNIFGVLAFINLGCMYALEYPVTVAGNFD